MAQVTNQPKIKIYAESEMDFFGKIPDTQLHFTENEKGVVDQVLLYQDGEKFTASR